MKKIFCLLCLLTCVGASHAATMCVPDLSTCESCSGVSYDGSYWEAECCGIKVAGVAFWGSEPDVDNQSQSLNVEVTLEDYKNYVFCFMTSPFLAKYYHVPSTSTYMYSVPGLWCMGLFNPRCAIAGCDLSIKIESDYSDPA